MINASMCRFEHDREIKAFSQHSRTVEPLECPAACSSRVKTRENGGSRRERHNAKNHRRLRERNNAWRAKTKSGLCIRKKKKEDRTMRNHFGGIFGEFPCDELSIRTMTNTNFAREQNLRARNGNLIASRWERYLRQGNFSRVSLAANISLSLSLLSGASDRPPA